MPVLLLQGYYKVGSEMCIRKPISKQPITFTNKVPKAKLLPSVAVTTLPIPPFVVSILTAFKAAASPKLSDRVFVSFTQPINTAKLIRTDLATAGIDLIDKDGNEICFHSLRNSYISFLANSNTPPKVVQELARHSDPRLTFNTYARTFEDAKQKAIGFLPNFGNLVLSTCLDKMCGKQQITIDNHRHKNSQGTLITAILADKQTPRVGLEPTT